MTITKVKGRSVWALDADLYVEMDESSKWSHAFVRFMGLSPFGQQSWQAIIYVLDGGGRDAGSPMFDSATQEALLDLNGGLTTCPFLIPRGRIAVAEVPGADMIEALRWSIDRPERSICLVCRET